MIQMKKIFLSKLATKSINLNYNKNVMESYDSIYKNIKQNWDKIAKPLDSLGKLEKIICKIGAAEQTVHPKAAKSVVLVLCADNGIVEEGVSQSGQEVTRICARNIALGKSAVGIMAEVSGTELITADFGINSDEKIPGVLDLRVANGTKNFAKEYAMTAEETQKAIQNGMELAKKCKEFGFDILCAGEMGIGNTTTSSAVAASILKCAPEKVTGRGAGLSSAGLKRKISVIKSAIEKYSLYEKSAFEILQAVGGFDIAGLAGVYLGAKKYKIPVVLDGAISLTAALVAENLESGTADFLIPSHKSREPLSQKISEKLGLEPVIDADMALGEGTGAVLMMGLIKSALAVYDKCVPFEKSGVEQYKRYD